MKKMVYKKTKLLLEEYMKSITQSAIFALFMLSSFVYAKNEPIPPKCPSVSEIQAGHFGAIKKGGEGASADYYFAIMLPGDFQADQEWSFVVNKIYVREDKTWKASPEQQALAIAEKAVRHLSGTPIAELRDASWAGMHYKAWYCDYYTQPPLEARASIAAEKNKL